jgi:hypothetical protein
MGDILGGTLVVCVGWLACIISDKYYKFKVLAYYWFVGAASGILGGLTFGGVI